MNRHKLLTTVVVGWLGMMMATDTDASEFVPPNDGYDWLRLSSGEWLRGELIGVFNDEVEFDSDILFNLCDPCHTAFVDERLPELAEASTAAFVKLNPAHDTPAKIAVVRANALTALVETRKRLIGDGIPLAGEERK